MLDMIIRIAVKLKIPFALSHNRTQYHDMKSGMFEVRVLQDNLMYFKSC